MSQIPRSHDESMEGPSIGDDAFADDALDEASVAEVIERLDNLWSHERRAAVAEVPNLIGQRCGKYTVRGVIGRGAFGMVYRATDDHLQRDVALKMPRPEVLIDPERLSRFQGEAATAAMLDHPTIVPVFEANLNGPTPYIASALCTGPDLGRWLASRSEPASAQDASTVIAKLAKGVHYAHEKGVLHRDLKPSNILLEPLHPQNDADELSSCQPRLTDFGLAKLLEGGLQDTRSSLLVGTPLYMAPEQLSSGTRNISRATDVYALGVVLYELLTLRTPFEGATYVEVLDKLRSGSPRPLCELNPGIPNDLETICAKCLEKDPADRYATAAELADDLERFLTGDSILARPTTWFDKLARWCRLPQRIATAGWFTCWYIFLTTVWMLLLWMGATFLNAIPGLATQTLFDIVVVTLFFGLPLWLLGWILVRRQSDKAFWPAAILSFIQFVTMVYSSTQDDVVFAHLYPNAFSKLATYTVLIMGSSIQLTMYLLAIPAWWRLRMANG